MKPAKLFFPLLGLAMSAAALALEPITYSGREALSSGSAWNGANSTEEDCAKLARKIENLKGQPLRRSAAEEQYEAECTNAPPTPVPLQTPLE